MGEKTRGNYPTGQSKCFSWCRCIQCRRKKKHWARKSIKPYPFQTEYLDKEKPPTGMVR